MTKSAFSDEYEAFLATVIAERKGASLTQREVAKRLNKPQSFVSKYERGERRLDVIEFLSVIRAIGADPSDVIKKIEHGAGSATRR